jgi:hypothetical protein
MKGIPNFTAYEVNALRKRKTDYHDKCIDFIEQLEEMGEEQLAYLTDKQLKWAWGIKMEAMELLDSKEVR